LGPGTVVLDLEDFIVSFNLLPIGSLLFVIFCTTRYGWGWNNFIKEANTGSGLKFPTGLRVYMTYILPLVILVLLVMGYIDFFSK
ncbi:MAG TPA: sodium-dependent transporter, partial [Synergistaceae bacterium]|nr:sodium-dependent transporter [Synergistaceae bacterium]